MPSTTRFAAGAAQALALLAPFAAHADVYKCAGDRNVPIYQEMPCPAGKELRNFQTDPPEITVLPGAATGREIPPAASSNRPAKNAKADSDASVARVGKAKGDASERKHVRSGMTEGEALAKLGKPDMTAGGKKNSARWTYLPAPGDPETITTFTIVNGVVSDVERKVVRK